MTINSQDPNDQARQQKLRAALRAALATRVDPARLDAATDEMMKVAVVTYRLDGQSIRSLTIDGREMWSADMAAEIYVDERPSLRPSTQPSTFKSDLDRALDPEDKSDAAFRMRHVLGRGNTGDLAVGMGLRHLEEEKRTREAASSAEVPADIDNMSVSELLKGL